MDNGIPKRGDKDSVGGHIRLKAGQSGNAVVDIPQFRADPGGNEYHRRHQALRYCQQYILASFPGHFELVGHLAHGVAHDQRVGVVVKR